MILRRLAHAIRKLDWFTVLLEIFIVVVGIVLGLQVDDWNEARKDRADEQQVLARLHADVENAESLASRLLNRRLERQQKAIALIDVIWSEGEEVRPLTADECFTLQSLHYFNIAMSELTTAVELSASGRMGIIRDANLRTALAELQQTRAAALLYVQIEYLVTFDVTHLYPELFLRRPTVDSATGEVINSGECDTDGIRANRALLNDLANNIDIYDAYVRDAIAPWSAAMRKVHDLLDRNLGIVHEAAS